jgi:hypothetical protein
MRARRLILAVVLWTCATAAHAAPLSLTQVQADRARLDVSDGEQLTVRFRSSAAAPVSLHIYDGRDIEIRRVNSQGVLPPGEHRLVWNGKDWRGRPAPDEAYIYTLSAATPDGERIEFDQTDLTGGETLTPRDVKWDASARKITYVLDKPARVNVRLGIKNGGPLLRTLIDWVPRAAGLQAEPWDGYDASHELEFAGHPSLDIGVSAFSLPDNTIFVGKSPVKVNIIESLPAQVIRRARSPSAKRMYEHSQQPLDERGDYTIELRLPKNLPRRDGLPVVDRPIPLTVVAHARDQARVLARRSEPVFFVDGQFAFENEMGFVPVTWVWDPANAAEGVHFLSVNLRGYEGNFGMATRKVLVKRRSDGK